MQYFGRAIDSVSKTWSSINPATLSGAIDVIVVEHEDGTLNSSPFHVRFGKFQLLRPSQKKVSFFVNGQLTDIPMKLGDGGEAFFVFKTNGYVPPELQTSPVISPVTSPETLPKDSSGLNEDMAYLDIGEGADNQDILDGRSHRIQQILTKINIPSKVEVNGDIILDMDGYKSDNRDVKDSEVFMKQILENEFGKDIDVKEFINKDLNGNIRISSSPIPESPLSSSQLDGMELMTPVSMNSDELQSNENNVKNNNEDKTIQNNEQTDNEDKDGEKYFFTLRLTSDQLKALPLKKGMNSLQYSVGKSTIVANLFLWDAYRPIVISDIDGTITKSDAMGHVMTMLGRDWTHEGVAQLFKEIKENGYNIMYLTARSVGLADTTRSYLSGIDQNNVKLPNGPVILSPDRTFQALKREIVLKKPEVFKMACLNDIRKLYFTELEEEAEDEMCQSEVGSWTGVGLQDDVTDGDDWSDINTNTNTNTGIGSGTAGEHVDNNEKKSIASHDSHHSEDYDEEQEEYFDDTEDQQYIPSQRFKGSSMAKHHLLNPHHHIPNEDLTPFYAGFGNRITDAISYRSVGIPSSRIFTIDPEGDVRMELLEMAGYKCSYVSIGELVDQFFPLVKVKKPLTQTPEPLGGSSSEGASSPLTKSVLALEKGMEETNDLGKGISTAKKLDIGSNARNKFTDFNYWRPDEVDWSLISDSEDDNSDYDEPEGFQDMTGSISVLDGDLQNGDGKLNENISKGGSKHGDDADADDDDEGWDNGVPPDIILDKDYDYDYDDEYSRGEGFGDETSYESDLNDKLTSYDGNKKVLTGEEEGSSGDRFRLRRILSPSLGFWRTSARAPATTATSEVNVYENSIEDKSPTLQ